MRLLFSPRTVPCKYQGKKDIMDRGAKKVRLVGNVIGKDHQGKHPGHE